MIRAGTGQCTKSRSFQRWVNAQRPAGNGRGFCDVRTRYSRMVTPTPTGPLFRQVFPEAQKSFGLGVPRLS